MPIYLYVYNASKIVYEAFKIVSLYFSSYRFVSWDPSTNLIVSLTSFPARIDHTWIAIESLFQQDLRPWKIVLVLSDEEFPTRELPNSILRQQARGLEILWTPRNRRSFQKLLPTRELYPDAVIVTVDDDIRYETWRLYELYEASKRLPGTIVGHRGWVVTSNENGLAPYKSWSPAGPQTKSEFCFLTGVGGVLYPPYVLPLDLLLNIDLAQKLCPLADDIWFWAVSRKSGVNCYCLGNHNTNAINRLRKSPALYNHNWLESKNDDQIANVTDHFGWRFS